MAVLRAALLAALLPFGAAAQDQPSGPAVETPGAEEEVEALIAEVQAQLARMNAAAEERDQALRFLEQQVEAATANLSSTGEAASSARAKAAALGDTLEGVARERERAEQERRQQEAALGSALEERQRVVADLEQRLAALDAVLAGSTQRAVSLEGEAAALRRELEERDRRLAALEAEREGTAGRADGLERALAEREEVARTKEAEAARLAALLASTTAQLRTVTAALGSTQTTVADQRLRIDELGQKLNQALAEEVEELSRYRSEFFGRLREALGDRPELRVVGDRFVFQSELLFASGSARLGEGGTAQLQALATTLAAVAEDIPPDLDWILRVDGHTDRQPVRADASFRSNWELSTERALAVVEFLVGAGIPAERLAATGFGEFRPLDAGEGEAAFRRNRRIEFKLTEG